MPLHKQRYIDKVVFNPDDMSIECHGHHDALLTIPFTVEWDDGIYDDREWSMSLKGSRIVKSGKIADRDK